MRDVNLLLHDDIDGEMKVGVKIRYSAPIAMATILREEDKIKVIFDFYLKDINSQYTGTAQTSYNRLKFLIENDLVNDKDSILKTAKAQPELLLYYKNMHKAVMNDMENDPDVINDLDGHVAQKYGFRLGEIEDKTSKAVLKTVVAYYKKHYVKYAPSRKK